MESSILIPRKVSLEKVQKQRLIMMLFGFESYNEEFIYLFCE